MGTSLCTLYLLLLAPRLHVQAEVFAVFSSVPTLTYSFALGIGVGHDLLVPSLTSLAGFTSLTKLAHDLLAFRAERVIVVVVAADRKRRHV